MFLFSRFFRFDVYTYVGHRKKTASSSDCDSLIFCAEKELYRRPKSSEDTALNY